MMGCLPPLTHDDWKFETEEQCMYKGYYRIAEVAEVYMRSVGVQQFKDLKIKMMYRCMSIDKILETEPSKIETPV